MRALFSFAKSWPILRPEWRPLLRPAIVTLALLAAYAAYEGWLVHTGAQKLLDSEVPAGNAKGHYEVIVNFAPEAFHITRVQAVGRVIEVRGRSIFVMDTSTEDARELARNYWIEDIKPWKGL